MSHSHLFATPHANDIANTFRCVTAFLLTKAPEKVTFSFGRNWSDFISKELNPRREQLALESLQRFLRRDKLNELYFLDVGCGSGLFSLGAWKLGARKIISFDVDPLSVRSCEELHERSGKPANWQIQCGSILDTEFLARIEPADIVYAWGSLHHTGQMWQAIRNAAALVRPRGLLDMAIYNRVTGRCGSGFWTKKKRAYNRASAAGKRCREVIYCARHLILPQIVRLQNPVRYLRDYGSTRGMNYWIDIRDWLGGYPYEYAATDEIFRFCHDELEMDLVNLRTGTGLGTNEFLFRKRV